MNPRGINISGPAKSGQIFLKSVAFPIPFILLSLKFYVVSLELADALVQLVPLPNFLIKLVLPVGRFLFAAGILTSAHEILTDGF